MTNGHPEAAGLFNSSRMGPWPSKGDSWAMGVSGTVRDRVTLALRQRILAGDLTQGTRLELDVLAEQFGTSRTPVREACLELSHEGLVQVTPRSGVTVIGISPSDVSDNFLVMSTLGGMAAKLATERMTEAQLTTIQKVGQELLNARDDDADLIHLNWQFHREINRASNSPRLLHLLRVSGKLVPQNLAVAPEQISCSRVEHRELLDALSRRDGDTARSVMEAHLLNAGALWSEKYSDSLRVMP
jgi:DNA-binding GntR family transcriptional regulator